MHQLDGRERTVLVDGLSHERQRRYVLVIPQSPLDIRRDIAGRMNFDLFGAHHRPTAFGLDATHGGVTAGPRISHAIAMRHLIEAVLGDHGTDLDRLEENVVAGIAWHGEWILS